MDQILETHPSNLSWEDPDWERGYRARELTAEEWNEQHDTFVRLYLDEDLSLTQVREIMAKEHNFYAKYVRPLIIVSTLCCVVFTRG